jgi:hypothetical protein
MSNYPDMISAVFSEAAYPAFGWSVLVTLGGVASQVRQVVLLRGARFFATP